MFRVVNSSTPTPNHAWFFTDCDTGQDIMDTGKDGGKTASPVNGPTCSADGINLDGNDDHVNIANSWEWEGTTSFAVYVKYDSIKSDVTSLYVPHNTAHHFWDFRGCSTGSPVTDSIAGDLVATPMNGPTCSADGLGLDGSDDWADIDDWEWGGTTSFEVYHWLGRSAWSSDGYFDGTIVYLKVWHGVELTESYVASTYLCDSKTFGNKLTSCGVCPDGKSSTYPNTATCTSCAAGKYSTGGNACTVCAAEKYQPSPNSASCITCPAGEYQPDKAISAALHISSIDCFPGKKLDDDVLDFTKHDAADDCESC
ncbi:hypothetical protein TrLO_g6179 [Triparma laevis f. longispina]|uniref:Tyrosine-protein kinase ephrin type A/B receptor-like domain-containing protein n=1 Tax=Triparma laevis f. longispina TaxID=1714387 RepID=A0A9W7L037_9STRA|nr:hypothetical protein TrLO_g6179 [Triparma laevis f. longispina]